MEIKGDFYECLEVGRVDAVCPDRALRFAEALGLLVKTDRVDAYVLAR